MSHARLQLALDEPNLKSALNLAVAVYDHIDLLELGTPLLLEYGMAAVSKARRRFPDLPILADAKIADAGFLEACLAFSRGADYVTVLGIADDATIRGAVERAERSGGKVVADLMHAPRPLERAEALAALGVHTVCLHMATDRGGMREEAPDVVAALRQRVTCRIAVAGGVTLASAPVLAAAGADVIIVGGAITRAADPAAAAQAFRQALDQVT